MSYEAIIGKIKLKEHPKADKLMLGNILNYQVVVGKNSFKDEELVIFFPEGGTLGHEFCYENSEYREGKGINKDISKKGYFESNRRIKMIKLRGEISEGYCAPISSLDYTKSNLIYFLKEGDTLTTVGSHIICEKYVSPATQKAINKAKKEGKTYFELPVFKKHFDTAQFKNNINKIPVGAKLIITSKLHGTSGRTGCFEVSLDIKDGWKGYWNSFKFLKKLYIFKENKITLVSGSRNMIFDPNNKEKSYIDKFRLDVEQKFKHLFLDHMVYYEIVGFNQYGTALFKQNVNSSDEFGKELLKKYNKEIIYSYGLPKENEYYDIYLYRLICNQRNYETEFYWDDMVSIANHLNVKTVPVLKVIENWDGNKEELYKLVSELANQPESLDNRHPREGICIRIEHPDVPSSQMILKFKSNEFCYLEGITKNNDEYVDLEEIS